MSKQKKDPLKPKEDVRISKEDKEQGFLETLKKLVKSTKKEDWGIDANIINTTTQSYWVT